MVKLRWARARAMLMVCGLSAFAATAASATCGPSQCVDTIAKLGIYGGGLYVQLSNGYSGLTNCTPDSGVYIDLPIGATTFNNYYAALLAAHLSGQPVALRTTDGLNRPGKPGGLRV